MTESEMIMAQIEEETDPSHKYTPRQERDEWDEQGYCTCVLTDKRYCVRANRP